MCNNAKFQLAKTRNKEKSASPIEDKWPTNLNHAILTAPVYPNGWHIAN